MYHWFFQTMLIDLFTMIKTQKNSVRPQHPLFACAEAGGGLCQTRLQQQPAHAKLGLGTGLAEVLRGLF